MAAIILSLVGSTCGLVGFMLAFIENRSLQKQLKWSSNTVKLLAEVCSGQTKLCLSTDPSKHSFAMDKRRDGAYVVWKRLGFDACVIKVFDNPDSDYNRREAEALVEHLNER